MKGKQRRARPLADLPGWAVAEAITQTIEQYRTWLLAVLPQAVPGLANEPKAGAPVAMLAAIQAADVLQMAPHMGDLAELSESLEHRARAVVATRAGEIRANDAALAYNLVVAIGCLAAAALTGQPARQRIDRVSRAHVFCESAAAYMRDPPPLPVLVPPGDLEPKSSKIQA